jgi:hypothetical protein
VPPLAPSAFQPHAFLTIQHREAALNATDLASVFGARDPSVLAGSWVEVAGLTGSICYSRNTGAYRVFAQTTTPTRLDLYIEPGTDALRSACDDCWKQLRKKLKKHRPSIQSAEVVEGSGRIAYEGRVGLKRYLWRRDTLQPVIVAIACGVAGVVVGVAKNTLSSSFVAAIPAVLNGLVYLGGTIIDWRTKRIQWQ